MTEVINQPTGEVPANGQAPASVQDQIAALLAGGNLTSLDDLTKLKGLIDGEANRLRAEEKQKSDRAKAERRGQLMTQVGQQILDSLESLGITQDFLNMASNAGLLGISIVFPAGENGATSLQQMAAVVSRGPTERKVAPDGSTPVKAPAGARDEPGDEATYNAETDEAERQEDNAYIERAVAEAVAKGRVEKSARNSTTWKVRHDRIKFKRTGDRVGHLKELATV